MGVQEDPLFCYANLAAQNLWNMDWKEFVGMPSRLSAELTMNSKSAGALIQTAHEEGFVDNYTGIRVTGEGITGDSRSAAASYGISAMKTGCC